MSTNNDDDYMYDDDELWRGPNLKDSCKRLEENDESLTSVIVYSDHVAPVCAALQANTVVESLSVSFLWFPCTNVECLNRFIMTSPSLKEFQFDTANGSRLLMDQHGHDRLPIANQMLMATCGASPIETLVGVPLCQSTALTFSNVLRINDKLRNISIDFPFEPTQGSRGHLDDEDVDSDDDTDDEDADEEADDDNNSNINQEGGGDLGQLEDEDDDSDYNSDSEEEEEEADDDFADPDGYVEMNRLVRTSLAPEVAQALSQSKVQSLSLSWLEHVNFRMGKTFFTALPGFLPESLLQIEFNNFCDSHGIANAISTMIQQSAPQLDSILLSFCRFGDGNFGRILNALERGKPNLKVLHYGFLHKGTAPVLARSAGSAFPNLMELGVGFHEGIEAFELFCDKLPYKESIKTLDIQLFGLHQSTNVDRFLRAVAVALPKLPNLCSITTVYTYSEAPVVEDTPSEFLAALEAHKHLGSITPRIPFNDKMVEYYLTRNRFRDRLGATKPVMVKAFQALNDGSATSMTLVKETLFSRDDWLHPGMDEGKPMPLVETAPAVRRFQPGPLF